MTILDAVVRFAHAQLGKPYHWGSNGPDSFDCSGLVYASYNAAGFKLPDNTANTYMAMVTPVPMSKLVPGMLVQPHPGHVQIYAGNGWIIEAPKSGLNVRQVRMWGFLKGGYFPGTYTPSPRSTYPGTLIRLGSYGPPVRSIQRIVHVTQDGQFGPKTEAAVKAWQRRNGLVVDGIVGPQTWRAMFQ